MSPRAWLAAMAAAGVLLMAGCAIGASTSATASAPQLVYICQQQPCANAQELTVSDAKGAPIASVGEYSGIGAFGANYYLYKPGQVYTPSVTWSWTSPAGYARWLAGQVQNAASVAPVSCTAGVRQIWIAPRGIWACKAGSWALVVRL